MENPTVFGFGWKGWVEGHSSKICGNGEYTRLVIILYLSLSERIKRPNLNGK